MYSARVGQRTVVRYPEWMRPAPEVKAAGSRSARGGERGEPDGAAQPAEVDVAASAGSPDLPEELIAALEREGLERVETIPLVAEEPPSAALVGVRAAGDGPERTVEFEYATSSDSEFAAVLVDEEGVFRWLRPEVAPAEAASRGGPAVGAEDRRLIFRIELDQPAERSTRGPLLDLAKKKLANYVTGYVFRFTARVVAGQTVKLLERKARTGGVRMASAAPDTWDRRHDFSDVELPGDRARALLFVHGTFSSTLGSFGALGRTEHGRRFLEDALAKGQYDAVLGFDHRTLSESPLDNALELLRLLRSLPAKHVDVDAVGYSRGGLVLRSLIEQVLADAPAAEPAKSLAFGRVVFVGAANGGTRLAEKQNWNELIDLYTNLAVGAARLLALIGAGGVAAILPEVIENVGTFARYLALEALDGGVVPGLAAMDPRGEFVAGINAGEGNGAGRDGIEYFAITSRFDMSRYDGDAGLSERFLLTLGDRVVDRLIAVENDLVVDTPSMTVLDLMDADNLKEVCEFGANGFVYHTVYFVQPRVVERLRDWFGLPKTDAATTPVGTVRGGKPSRSSEVLRKLQAIGTTTDRPVRRTRQRAAAADHSPLEVEVVWGDLREVDADVFAVGHYQDLLPQRAERVLDEMVSPNAEELVLTRFTRRGMIDGRVGKVSFFPLSRKPAALAAVCGMGHHGTFGEAELRQLHHRLFWSVSSLPGKHTLCTVLIGSGEGALSTESAVRGLLTGIADGLAALGDVAGIRKVKIVEILGDRAQRILEQLSSGARPFDMELVPKVRAVPGGTYSEPYKLALLVATAATARRSMASLLEGLPLDVVETDGRSELAEEKRRESLTREVTQTLAELGGGDGKDVLALARRFSRRIVAEGAPTGSDAPTRVSYLADGPRMKAAAITNTTTAAERPIQADPKIILQAAQSLVIPTDGQRDPAVLLSRLIVPPEFRGLFGGRNPIIFEVDRTTAALPWEALLPGLEGDVRRPICLERPVARQIRTTYSPRPTMLRRKTERLRVLVIGDPLDNLPHARDEAHSVARFMHGLGYEVNTFIGSKVEPPTGSAPPVRPASRLVVLDALLFGQFDLVHYAGHADYDVDEPSRTGWSFPHGALTAREISCVEEPPALVVSNACLSGLTAPTPTDAKRRPQGELGLLPSLADEFFNIGVRNYIGTAAYIEDELAIQFTEVFYRRFLGSGGRVALGEALLEARQMLEQKAGSRSRIWAAYQHYGDPATTLEEISGAGGLRHSS